MCTPPDLPRRSAPSARFCRGASRQSGRAAGFAAQEAATDGAALAEVAEALSHVGLERFEQVPHM